MNLSLVGRVVPRVTETHTQTKGVKGSTPRRRTELRKKMKKPISAPRCASLNVAAKKKANAIQAQEHSKKKRSSTQKEECLNIPNADAISTIAIVGIAHSRPVNIQDEWYTHGYLHQQQQQHSTPIIHHRHAQVQQQTDNNKQQQQHRTKPKKLQQHPGRHATNMQKEHIDKARASHTHEAHTH